MDKEANVQKDVNQMDLPAVNDTNKEENINNQPTEIDMPAISNSSATPENNSDMELPTPAIELPEENKQVPDLNMTLPTLNIASSESVDDNAKPVDGNSVLDNKADFQTIFNVESEEAAEVKKEENKQIDKYASPTVKVNKEESALPQDKALSESEREEKLKNRQANFNGTETVIYEIKEEKEGNPIVVVLYFLALISLVIALPFITKKVVFNNGTPVTENKKPEEKQDDQFYVFGRSSVRAKIDNLEFTNFVKHQNNDGTFSLTFNLSNKQQKAYTFDQKYYVVFYKEDKIIYRALIYSKDAIGANAITSVELPITEQAFNEAERFKLTEILTPSYTKVNLSEEDGEYKVLTCKSKRDEMRYYFLDNKLAKVKETYKDQVEEITKKADESQATYEYRKKKEKERFDQSIEKYYKLSESYKKINDFSSIFVSSANEFSMYNEFNYQNIPDTVINNLNEFKFFRYNESKDVINFEMEAMSYHCG